MVVSKISFQYFYLETIEVEHDVDKQSVFHPGCINHNAASQAILYFEIISTLVSWRLLQRHVVDIMFTYIYIYISISTPCKVYL